MRDIDKAVTRFRVNAARCRTEEAQAAEREDWFIALTRRIEAQTWVAAALDIETSYLRVVP